MEIPKVYQHVIESPTKALIQMLLGIYACYKLGVIIYRLYFHPLVNVPGPKFAALSSLPAMYYDIICGGQYIWAIEKWHKQYGPIIRIRPNTVHINDPLFLDAVYGTAGKRRHKSHLACNSFGNPFGSVATYDHDLHRRRRAATAPYFSMSAIRRLEPIILSTLTKLLHVLNNSKSKNNKEDKVINPNLLFSAATADIITDYAFGDSWGNLEMGDWNQTFFNFVKEGTKMWHVNSYFPFLMQGLLALPVTVSARMMPGMGHVLRFFGLLDSDLAKLKQESKATTEEIKKPTVFNALLDPSLPASERSDARLLCEAKVLLAAGTDTTAMTLTKILYHILSNETIFHRLKKELMDAVPDEKNEEELVVPKLSQIEHLPYLNAVVQEGLRLHPAGTMRQERIAPDEDLVYHDVDRVAVYVIPKGYILAMTAPLLARLEEYYPDPLVFNPSRWLTTPASNAASLATPLPASAFSSSPSPRNKTPSTTPSPTTSSTTTTTTTTGSPPIQQDKNSLTFSRGSRICLGINLAYMELRLFVAGLVRNFDIAPPPGQSEQSEDPKGKKRILELVNTTSEDVDMAADFGIPFIKAGREGVKVTYTVWNEQYTGYDWKMTAMGSGLQAE